MKKLFPYLLLSVLIVSGCGKEKPNPFDDPDNLPPDDTTGIVDLDPTSFVGLHQNTFRPFCANSGCHDGTFEPDFRTIEGAYNSMILHPVIKNDANATYNYRVKPGSLTESMLWLRLTEDIDGISGIMPLDAFYDPGSQWNAEKEEHLANISAWIMGGALDMFGNEPTNNDQQPGIAGIYAEADGNECQVSSRIIVPLGAQQLSVWFALHDLETPTSNFEYTKVKMSGVIDRFDTIATQYDLQLLGSAETYPDFLGESASFQHKFTFDVSAFPNDSTFYLRVFIKDPMQTDTTNIPQNGSYLYMKKLFSWIKKD